MKSHTSRRRAAPLAALVACLALLTAPVGAQVVPNAHWRTIRTEHFEVHFAPDIERVARRAAASAERAYGLLSAHLTRPREPIDLVVADNVDYSNGNTTPFPTNRIVIYAHPALNTTSLRYYDDWLDLVITHELTHVFHLDRTGGWWHAAQLVFGRAPPFFPNFYEPAWVSEGLATYYESAITGAGRVNGTYETMLLSADVHGSGLRRPDEWNLQTTRYPGGDLAYGYGSLFFDFLARTRGDSAVRAYVEHSSGATVPFLLNRYARQSFGISFTDAWREWRDSLARRAAPAPPPLPMWRSLTHAGRAALYPRWTDSSSLIVGIDDGRSTTHAERVTANGATRSLGRRNSLDAASARADGAIVFAQIDFIDPFRVRSDLWLGRNGREHRLTHGARLSAPDVRADGQIIAVRSIPDGAELVRVSRDGRVITPITSDVIDTAWTEPRWSPAGDRIAATRWTRGGFADVVILDTLGHIVRAIEHDRAFDASPSWSPDGKLIFFSSDRTGVSELYFITLDAAEGSPAAQPRLLSRATTGLFYPTLSRDGRALAASRYEQDGYHVGVARFDSAGAQPTPLDPSFAPERDTPLVPNESASRSYSPWRTLWPRYWLPFAGQTSRGTITLGAFTSGQDVIGVHTYSAQALFDPRGNEHSALVAYEYAGLGQPFVDLSAEQSWDRTGVDSGGMRLGDLRRRARTYDASLTFTRPRVRESSFLSLGGEVEQRDYFTEPAPLLSRLVPYYRAEPQYRSLLVSAGWSNVQHPALAVSLEDGIAFSATERLRWVVADSTRRSNSVVGSLAAYKSLDWGGFAHHVIALRAAGGYASGDAPGEYSVGGTSGQLVALLPGLTSGEQRTFFVRGFAPGAKSGSRAVSGTAEYRAPLAAPNRGFGFWPAFLSRMSVSAFADAGAASNTSFTQDSWIASVGAELALDAALEYDIPYRIRLGFATPLVDHSDYVTQRVSVFLLFGSSF